MPRTSEISSGRQFVVLWDRVPPATRDRSARFTAEQIAQAAFVIAESENLSAASIKRVANRLQVPAARLEQYVSGRDELFDLMLDVCLGEIALPDASAALDWRGELKQLAEATYSAASAHPWLVELIGGRSPSGPNGLRFVERALATLGAAGLDVRSSALCFNAVLAYVCGSVRVETRRRPATEAVGRAHGDAKYLSDAVSADEYPCLAELFAEAADLTSAESFLEGMDCLLDGIAARIGSEPTAWVEP